MFHHRRALGAVRRPFVAAGGGGDSAAVSQFLARVTTQNTTHHDAYAALIDGLVADGVWTKLDALWVMAAAETATALTNLKSSNFGMTNNGAAFTANVGYTGNGTSAYINTGYTPDAGAPVTWADDNACFGIFIQSPVDVGGAAIANAAAATYRISPRANSVSYGYAINNMNVPGFTDATTTTQALTVNNGTTPGTGGLWRNGSSTAIDTFSGGTSINSCGSPLTLLARNIGASRDSFSPNTLSAAWTGTVLTGAQTAALHSRLNTYMTVFGVNY